MVNMLPPNLTDSAADSVNLLLIRLERINPENEIFLTLDQGPNGSALTNRLRGILSLSDMQISEQELLELNSKLKAILTPRLHFVKRRGVSIEEPTSNLSQTV